MYHKSKVTQYTDKFYAIDFYEFSQCGSKLLYQNYRFPLHSWAFLDDLNDEYSFKAFQNYLQKLIRSAIAAHYM